MRPEREAAHRGQTGDRISNRADTKNPRRGGETCNRFLITDRGTYAKA